MRPVRDARRGGFTLIDLLTTMIVVSILAAIAIPSFKEAVARADARKVLTDVAAIRIAVHEYRQDANALPRGARWGATPPDLAPHLNDVDFVYKDVEYRLTSNRRRGRVDLTVRYPRDSAIGAALVTFAQPGSDSGSVTWSRRRTRFRILEQNR